MGKSLKIYIIRISRQAILPVLFLNTPLASAAGAFKENGALYLLSDDLRGSPMMITSDVDKFAAGAVVAFNKGNTLYVVTDRSRGSFTAVTSGVDEYKVVGEKILFRKESSFYIVTDVSRGDYSTIDSRSIQF